MRVSALATFSSPERSSVFEEITTTGLMLWRAFTWLSRVPVTTTCSASSVLLTNLFFFVRAVVLSAFFCATSCASAALAASAARLTKGVQAVVATRNRASLFTGLSDTCLGCNGSQKRYRERLSKVKLLWQYVEIFLLYNHLFLQKI